MRYEIQFARITNADKLNDRFLNCKHTAATELSASNKGDIFTLIEILSPWFNSAKIGQTILSRFSESYFQGGSTSDLVNFENSLKEVNEYLASITQNGETDWIGNLNGILAVIVENNLHLAPTGQVEAYIFRDGKINQLTQAVGTNAETHPLKTFSNVVSGQLKINDKILIANKGLFEHLPLESVHQIVILNDPSTAAAQISKFLRKDKTKHTNLVIINLGSKEELSGQTLNHNLENVFYLDKSSESIFSKIGSFWQTIISPLGKIVSSKVAKTSGGLIKKTTEKFKNRKPAVAEKTDHSEEEKPQDKFQREFLSHDNRDDHLLKDEEIKYSPDLYVHYYQEKKERAKKESKLKPALNFVLEKLKNLVSWFIATWRDRSRRKYIYIILACLIIVILGLFIAFKSKAKEIGNLEAQKILDEAIAAEKDGKNALLSGNSEKAKENFVIAITKAQDISGVSQVSKDAEDVLANSYQEMDKLISATRFRSLEPIVKLPTNDGKGLFIVSGQAYILTDNDIYRANILGGTPEKVTNIAKTKGSFTTGTILGNIIYLYTNNQNLFEFNTSASKLSAAKITDDSRWETANSLSGFVGSLYLLDGVVGEIYKHSSTEDTFDKGEEYIANKNSQLKESVSLAVDGSIYVLKNNGEVIKIQRSKIQDFSLKNLPTPYDKIIDPKKIYTDSDTPSLYILDNGSTEEKKPRRILEFDKDGFFVRQYILPDNFNAISDFQVSVKSKKIWILSEDGLYEISI